MADAYVGIGPISVLIFALPLYTTRAAYKAVVDIRDMFTQTVTALASAIDARDPSTKQHSEHVSLHRGRDRAGNGPAARPSSSSSSGRGLLHDIGKIGIPDAVLLKPDRLDPRGARCS